METKAMAKQTVTENSPFSVEVSRDRLKAIIRPQRGEAESPPIPSNEEVLQELTRVGLAIDGQVKERVAAFCALLESEDDVPEEFAIAEGRPAEDGRDEEFVWDAAFGRTVNDPDNDEAVDYYTFNSIVTVDAGTPIGRITPQVPAKNGVDVYGEAIRPHRQQMAIELADTVRRSAEDSAQIVAQVAGRVVYASGRLSIVDVLEIRGDVDFSAGNVDSLIDVNIGGTVHDRFVVESAKSVSVGGAVEAATVLARGDVAVRGGIVARHEGRVTAGGTIGAKFCDEAHLEAEGDIIVAKELMNCRVHCEGKILAKRGAVIGGYVYAREGLEIGTIGSDANVQTRICVGVHPTRIKAAEMIDRAMHAKLETVEKIRQTVQPLMTDLRRLAPAQREQATELLFKADEAELAIKEDEKRRAELLEAGREQAGPRIVVGKIVYPGVTISIGSRAATIAREVKGPVVIEERKVDNVTEIVAVNQLTASVHVLPNTIVPVDDLLKGFEREEEPAPSADARCSPPSEEDAS